VKLLKDKFVLGVAAFLVSFILVILDEQCFFYFRSEIIGLLMVLLSLAVLIGMGRLLIMEKKKTQGAILYLGALVIILIFLMFNGQFGGCHDIR
jgi:hypothetical protein